MIGFSRPLVLIGLALIPFLYAVLRDRRGIVWRLSVLTLLILALADPLIAQRRVIPSVLFLVDRSPSVTATVSRQEAEDQLDAIVAANPDRRFGVITFAQQAWMAQVPGAASITLSEGEHPLGERTDLAAAVDLALASRQAGESLELVLASDGRITDGLAAGIAAAQRAAVPISTLPLGRSAVEDVALVALESPGQVELDRPFAIRVAVRAQAKTEATLAIYRDESLLDARDVSLSPGSTTVTLADTIGEPGLHVYRARVRTPADPIPENDALEAIVETVTQPQLLVVAPDDSEIDALLTASGRSFSRRAGIPPLAELSGFREVLLADQPLLRLSQEDVDTLETFVGDLGGGLVVVEGEAALRGFAGGGIERLLPVSYTVPQQGREASQALVYLLDHSASMRGYAEGASKIDILKESVAASVELLDEDTQVGVIAFDREFAWLLPVERLGDGAALYEGLRSLTATGGTDLYYPIVAALDALEPADARMKSILLFSDGKTVDEYRDFAGLTARLAADEGITLSAIAIGIDPNLPLLQALVSAGHGMLYRATNFAALPQISIQATQRLSRSRFITGSTPVAGPLATGNLADIPALDGYALTFPKPTADVLLSAGADPILARWRFGLGQICVLNTDLSGEWSTPWLSWNGGALLLDAILATAEPAAAVVAGLHPIATANDEQIDLLVDARTPDGGFANYLDLSATLLRSDATRPLEQIAAGLYRATFPVSGLGGHVLRIDDETRRGSTSLSVCVPYPAEYQATGLDSGTLREIAAQTGGIYLEDEILPGNPGPLTLRHLDLHVPFLLAGLVLFVAELGLRKLPRRRSRGP